MRLMFLLIASTYAAWSQTDAIGAWNSQGVAGPATPGANPPSLLSISITPANPIQFNGSAVAFIATGNYSDSSTQNLTTTVTWSIGNASIASVGPLTTTQSVSCLTTGSTNISAMLGAVTGTTNLVCQPVPSSAVALPTTWVNAHECDTTLSAPNQIINYPATGSGGAWTGGGPYASTMAGLNTAVANAEAYRNAHPTAGAVLINIPAGFLGSGSSAVTLLQTAGDNSTNCIAVVTTGTLPAGQTVCAHGIQDNIAESADPGVRNPACNAAGADDVAQMWTLEGTAGGNSPVLKTGPADANGVGPHHYLIVGLEAREQAGLNANLQYLVAIGSSSLNETQVGQLASHIYIDRSWVHGDRTDSFTGANNVVQNILMDCAWCAFTNSQISQTIDPGTESHGVLLVNGAGPFKITHNWMEGPSIDIFCGGAAMAITTGIQSCNDGEVRRNRLSYPAAWLGTAVWPGSQSMVRKTALELKSANRVLSDGNILENVDDSGGQYRAFGLNPKAQNAALPQYYINVTNVTWTDNILRHVCAAAGSYFASRSSAAPNGQGVSLPMQDLTIANNLWYDADKPAFCNPVDNNGLGVSWLAADTQFTGCTAVRDSLGQTATLTCVNSGTGMAQTDTSVGDPVIVSKCVDATFNAGVDATGKGLNTAGPPALAGTNPNGLTIVYANPGTANATTTGCTFDNFQGYPKNQLLTHNTFVFSSASQGVYVDVGHSAPTGGGLGWAFMQNNTVDDNIILGQGVGGQGTSDSLSGLESQRVNWDLTTAVWHHDVYTGRTCSNYLEVLAQGGSQTQCTASNQGNGTCQSFCPATPYCAGTDPTAGGTSGASSCVGFNGLMSATAMNTNLADWHGYRLCHAGDASCARASLYAAGQVQQASDGSDRGANFAAIDNAQTQTQYSCSSACGAGPFAD